MIVMMFVVVWVGALSIWRYGKIESRWHDHAHKAQQERGEIQDHAAAGIVMGPITDGFTID